MNRYAIQHIVDSSYCFPISPKDITLRLRVAKDDITEASVVYESKYVIGDSQKKADMHKSYSSELYDYYEVTLHLEDTRLGYVFYINDGTQNYYYSEDGVTLTYDFKIGYYNFFQYPYINNVDIMPMIDWMKNASFYQIFIDRFSRGNFDKQDDYINCKWGDAPTQKMFAGGDLRGIIDKLDYIHSLGCDGLYLTPIFTSISNHKYDISNYYEIDPMFGNLEDLRTLVNESHKRDMYVVLDAVFNHASDKLFQFRDVLEKARESRYFDWFVIDGDSVNSNQDNYEVFASCRYMPKLNTSNQEVQQFLIDIATHYIREYDIDGWRLDVSDEISHYFWRRFRNEVKAVKQDAVIIGENWHDANSNLRGDQYDSIMNYAFTKACLDYLAYNEFDAMKMSWKLNEILMRNTDTVNHMMMNLLDSHDTVRFLTEVGEDKNKLRAALAILYTFVGAPCIFYGTENYASGGYDPGCRICMNWDDISAGKNEELRDYIRGLNSIRKECDIPNAVISIEAVDEILVIRNKGKKEVVLLINNTDNSHTACGVTVGASTFIVLVNGEKRLC